MRYALAFALVAVAAYWLRARQRRLEQSPEPQVPRYTYTFTGHDESKAVESAARSRQRATLTRHLHDRRTSVPAAVVLPMRRRGQ